MCVKTLHSLIFMAEFLIYYIDKCSFTAKQEVQEAEQKS